jgi:hypothetical protein
MATQAILTERNRLPTGSRGMRVITSSTASSA